MYPTEGPYHMNEIKAIVVDLDGVLWEGKCHEGLQCIKINNQIITLLQTLRDKGIVLDVLSANNRGIAEGTLSALGLLRLFSSMSLGFCSKEKGMQILLGELNILPQNILYIDDTPYERDLISDAYPEMTVIDVLPALKLLAELNDATPTPKTQVSCQRPEMYLQESKRKAEEERFSSAPERFLKELNTSIFITYNVRKSNNLLRIEEMFHRNHQFNSTTTTHDFKKLKNIANNKNSSISMVTVEDKYGSCGICGCIIFKKLKSKHTILITDITFSCRVQKHHIISSTLCYMLRTWKNQGFLHIVIHFYPTQHNEQLLQLFEEIGLSKNPDPTEPFMSYTGGLNTIKSKAYPFIKVENTPEVIDQPQEKIPFVYNAVEKFVSKHPLKGTILDIGSGAQDALGKNWYHTLSDRFKSIKLKRVDIDPYWAPDLIADAKHLETVPDDSTNVILCFEVLEHIDCFWLAISEFLRVLKPGGVLLLSAPMNLEIHGRSDDYYRFTPHGLKHLLEHATCGSPEQHVRFQVEKVYTEGDALFPTRTFVKAKKVVKKENINVQ